MIQISLPTPIAGWIVSCFFPEEGSDIPADKLRPVLVMGYVPEENIIFVVYGTGEKNSYSPGSSKLKPYQIEVDPSNFEGRTSNLQEVTRFNFRRTMPLKYTKSWFKPFASKSSVYVGTLHQNIQEDARKAYLIAEEFLNEKSGGKAGCQKKETIITYKKKK